MKYLAMVVWASILAACSSLGIEDPGPEIRAARNLCEVMRSFRPYDPNECGEQSGGVPPGYRAYRQ